MVRREIGRAFVTNVRVEFLVVRLKFVQIEEVARLSVAEGRKSALYDRLDMIFSSILSLELDSLGIVCCRIFNR